MSSIQGIIASISAGTVAPPVFVGSWWAFDGDDLNRGFAGYNGWWSSSVNGGGLNTPSIFSNPAPAWNTITYANGTSGHTYDFNGTQWMSSSALQDTSKANTWLNNAASIDMWFYPTANDVQIMSESSNTDVVSGYHATILEINSSGNLVGRFWPFGSGPGQPPALTSSNTVTLNAWNHVYMRIDQGTLYMSLNDIGQYSLSATTYIGPGASSTYFIIGLADGTRVASDNPFQGKIGKITIRDDAGGTSYSTDRSKYIPTPKTFESGIPPAAGTNANWSGATIVGSHTVWPPGTPGSQTGVIISSGTYIDVPVTLNKDSCTVEIVAELFPTQFWATMWGNDSWTAGQGYVAYFNGASTLNTGSPNGAASLNLNTIAIGDRAHWVFTFSGSTVVVYRNGTALTTQSFTAPTAVPFNDMYIGARHNNDGVGPTDFCPGTYYYFKVSDTVLDSTAVTAKYDSIKGNYGLP